MHRERKKKYQAASRIIQVTKNPLQKLGENVGIKSGNSTSTGKNGDVMSFQTKRPIKSVRTCADRYKNEKSPQQLGLFTGTD